MDRRGGKPALNAACFTLPILPAGGMGAPSQHRSFETASPRQRNIFRQAFQKRADASLIKVLPIGDHYNLK